MTDLIKPLAKKIKFELNYLIGNSEGRIGLLNWIKTEYSRYMITSYDDYAFCLQQFIADNPDNKFVDVYSMLLTHLGKYGSTQAIFRAASELLNEQGELL